MTESLKSANAGSKIVLAVDDLSENLVLIERAVTMAGYSFIGTRSGAECLTMTTRIVPRLILLDIQMPDLNGFETCRRLRLGRQLEQVPIVFLTARKSVEDVREGMKVGGSDFIVKPFDPAKLQLRIQRWVARGRRLGG